MYCKTAVPLLLAFLLMAPTPSLAQQIAANEQPATPSSPAQGEHKVRENAYHFEHFSRVTFNATVKLTFEEIEVRRPDDKTLFERVYTFSGLIVEEQLPDTVNPRVRLHVIPEVLNVSVRDLITNEEIPEDAAIFKRVVLGGFSATLDLKTGELSNPECKPSTASQADRIFGSVLEALYMQLPEAALEVGKDHKTLRATAFIGDSRAKSSPATWESNIRCDALPDGILEVTVQGDSPMSMHVEGEALRDTPGLSEVQSSLTGTHLFHRTQAGLRCIYAKTVQKTSFKMRDAGMQYLTSVESATQVSVQEVAHKQGVSAPPVTIITAPKEAKTRYFDSAAEVPPKQKYEVIVSSTDMKTKRGNEKPQTKGARYTIEFHRSRILDEVVELDGRIIEVSPLPENADDKSWSANYHMADHRAAEGQAIRLQIDRRKGAFTSRTATDEPSPLDEAISNIGVSIPTEAIDATTTWTCADPIGELQDASELTCTVDILQNGSALFRMNTKVDDPADVPPGGITTSITMSRSPQSLLPIYAIRRSTVVFPEDDLRSRFGTEATKTSVTWRLLK